METPNQSLDDLIMTLVGMGFELEDVQEAISVGKLAAQDAIEWLLNGKPRVAAAQSAGTLRLAPLAQSPGSESPSHQMSMDTGGGAEAPSVDAPPDDAIVSRMHMNSEQRQIKQRFEQKQRDEARKGAVREKHAEKKARDQIRQQIQEDRERKKLMRSPGEVTSPGPSAGSGVTARGATGGGVSPAATSGAERTTMLQIRLPSGTAVKKSFPAAALLSEVREYVAESSGTTDNLCLIQPFPRQEYGAEHMERSLQDLGLVPSGSLVVKKLEGASSPPTTPTTPATPTTPTATTTAAAASAGEVAMETQPGAADFSSHGHASGNPIVVGDSGEGSDGEDPQPGGDVPPQVGFDGWGDPIVGGHAPGSHPWGSGNRLEGPSADRDPPHVLGMEVDLDPPGGNPGPPPYIAHHGPAPNIAHAGPELAHPGVPFMPQGDWLQGYDGDAWGLGQRLIGEVLEADNLPHHRKDPKQLAAEAAGHRVDRPPLPEGGRPRQPSPSPAAVPSPLLHLGPARLTEQVIQHVSSRICDTRNPITGLQGLPADVADKLLDHLIRRRLLRNKTLNPFVSSHLRKIVLDCYPYTTNELLTALRLHTCLVHLSLCSCPLINDKGLQVLQSLKRLKFLNLGSNRQLTSNCLHLLKDLTGLVTLVLEDTGVTDEGVIQYAETVPPNLQHLDLCRTEVTHRIIPALQALPSLRTLNLEQTAVACLSGVQSMEQLEALNVASTPIVTDSLLCLTSHPSLRVLNISNTPGVDGDLALQYISGLKLQVLTLPSRLQTTYIGISHIAAMPLTALDLTNYINVSDTGMESVGKITSLKKLHLSNTKITDQGMYFLSGLTELVELSLARTDVTDAGAAVLRSFPRLQELSLSETGITNVFLRSGTLDVCYELAKLNLSRNHITDKGVRHLKLPNLILLHLDGIMVAPSRVEILKENAVMAFPGCPLLQRVSLKNVRPPEDDDD